MFLFQRTCSAWLSNAVWNSPKWKFNWTLAIPLTDSQNTRTPMLYYERFLTEKPLISFFFFTKQNRKISCEIYDRHSFFSLTHFFHRSIVCVFDMTLHCVTMQEVIEPNSLRFLLNYRVHVGFSTASAFKIIRIHCFTHFFRIKYDFFYENRIKFIRSQSSD